MLKAEYAYAGELMQVDSSWLVEGRKAQQAVPVAAPQGRLAATAALFKTAPGSFDCLA
jgi:hypothetical protein